MTHKKKLIEVALPLEAISQACKPETENPFLKDHPRSLHVWWARTPLVACRAVLFASLVDDPSSRPDLFPDEASQEVERARLFKVLRQLADWGNTENQEVLEEAQKEIERSTGGSPPPLVDPFCGRGSIPLEAQRLGLKVYASDLNPVAVLITKAVVEIPARFPGVAPVNPLSQQRLATGSFKGARGLGEDVRYYGAWIRNEAQRRIGSLYPGAKLLATDAGGRSTVIAWLWARRVNCPNPACGARMPLVRSFWLSTKPGKKAWVAPIVDRISKTVKFEIRTGEGEPAEGTVNRRGAKCIVCDTPVAFDHIRSEGRAGRMDVQLLATVAQGDRSRSYLAPDREQEAAAFRAKPQWIPESDLPDHALGFRVQLYGMTKHADLFTNRQLVALTTFSDLVGEAREFVLRDAIAAGIGDSDVSLADGGSGAAAYADAITTYLTFALSRLTDYSNALATWNSANSNVRNLFQRQAVPMAWDFAEANTLGSELNMEVAAGWVASGLNHVVTAQPGGTAIQLDAAAASITEQQSLVSTDPPYYDNIGYADLSDFFYVWLRRSLSGVWPKVCSTLLTPKEQELVATPFRFEGGSVAGEEHFEKRFGAAMSRIQRLADPEFPVTIYYAYKQTEDDRDRREDAIRYSTGWETMLQGLLTAGFQITGTWPIRTTKKARSVARNTNALASSVVLACRPRSENAAVATKQEFVNSLKRGLPKAVHDLQRSNIAPVDLAQASIGPGMGMFSRYSKVIEADGSEMSVRKALEIINQVLDEVLTEQEDEYDAATRWAITWFDQFGMNEATFGEADVLARAKGTAVNALEQDGLVRAKAGKVRLLNRNELEDDWDPLTDRRLRVWEITQHLILALETQGESGAADIVRRAPSHAEIARNLAYRLFMACERNRWAKEAIGYNALVTAWPEIRRLAGRELRLQTERLI